MSDYQDQMAQKAQELAELSASMRRHGLFPGDPAARETAAIDRQREGLTAGQLDVLAEYFQGSAPNRVAAAKMLASKLNEGGDGWREMADDLVAYGEAYSKRGPKAQGAKLQPGETFRQEENLKRQANPDRLPGMAACMVMSEGKTEEQAAKLTGLTIEQVQAAIAHRKAMQVPIV